MQSITMQLDGMSCGHCVRSVTEALSSVEGVSVQGVRVGAAEVNYDPNVTSLHRISEALAEAGYGVRQVEPAENIPRGA